MRTHSNTSCYAGAIHTSRSLREQNRRLNKLTVCGLCRRFTHAAIILIKPKQLQHVNFAVTAGFAKPITQGNDEARTSTHRSSLYIKNDDVKSLLLFLRQHFLLGEKRLTRTQAVRLGPTNPV